MWIRLRRRCGSENPFNLIWIMPAQEDYRSKLSLMKALFELPIYLRQFFYFLKGVFLCEENEINSFVLCPKAR